MAIMKKYVQGELPENMYGNEAAKQGDSKTNVVKGGSAFPADYAEGIPCRVSSDLHEWRNDFSAVSNINSVKLNSP